MTTATASVARPEVGGDRCRDGARGAVPVDRPEVAGDGCRDRGSGTILLLGVVLVVVVVALGLVAVGGAVVARHRAMAGADLAALAAADQLARAGPDACGEARRVAERQEVELVSCEVDGLVVDVLVEAAVPGLPGAGMTATMRSRAGPAGP